MKDARDLVLLIHRYMDGAASAEEMETLNRILREDAEARRLFAEMLNLDAALGAMAGGERMDELLPGACSIGDDGGAIDNGLASRRANERTRPLSTGWIAAAAVLIVALTLTLVLMRSTPEQPPVPPVATPAYARVTGLADAVWAEGSPPLALGGEIRSAKLKLAAGTVQMLVDRGVALKLSGPAELQFADPMRLVVFLGKVTAEVGPNAKGFTIETAQARVVDYGTRFGVDASDAAHTDVIVFQGEVRIMDKQAQGPPIATLTTGQAMRVDKSRRAFRIVCITSDGREEDWSTQGVGEPRTIIAAVRDNMAGTQPSLRNFYRIVPGGLREDARAYADSPHEWNGLDASGIPEFLLGADLVQTFNIDNMNYFMQMTVTVSRPCTLYVLADRRNPPPQWLKERFTDTGIDIGWEYVDPRYKIFAAKGPGNGRKLFPFGIWKLEVQQAGEVKLGPPYFEKFKDPKDVKPNWMYGVAAKAL